MYGREHLDMKENMDRTFFNGGAKGLLSAPRYQIPSQGRRVKQCHYDPNRYADK
jgi:hypothetical protein